MGSIVQRKTRDRRTGIEGTRYYAVYYTGTRRWSERLNAWKPVQRWEPIPETLTSERARARFLAQREGQARGVPHGTDEGRLFGELAAEWLRVERTTKKPTTWANYDQMLRLHVLPILGQRPIGKITPREVQALASRLIEEHELAASWVRQIVTHLRAIFRRGIEWEWIARNPADFKIRLPRHTPPAIEPLDAARVRAMLDNATGRWFALLAVGVLTGMRIGELLAMRWANVEWDAGRYIVTETLTQRRGFQSPKTPLSLAAVPLSPYAVQVLRDHRQEQAQERIEAGSAWVEYDLVFPALKGTPLTQRSAVKFGLWPALDRAGLPRVKFHTLRHTCASLMIANGENLKVIQTQLRHGSIQQTMDVYGHLYPQQQSEAVSRLDTLILGA